jgi:DNA invertase Pin-like site-specific DNA recombinase
MANSLEPFRNEIRAARYLRMSTDHQRYSTENQAAAIDAYAAQRGIVIVQTYIDRGKSGLTIEGRDGLKALIADVVSKQADFGFLLVYDVSRWGRFQDADESAHYEFLCRRSGVQVVYCAEQFENDGSPAATIIKSLKRAMAGEYSRELSTKTFAGQCRLVQLGFRIGGAPGVGLRRMLIDSSGVVRGVLRPGEQKSIHSDRVVLVLGPPEEVAVVRRVYGLFLDEKMSIQSITDKLNAEGLTTDLGHRWTYSVVRTMLTNEKYLGHNVFNKISRKLQGRAVRNPPDQWVRVDSAYPAIIDEVRFAAVRQLLFQRCRRLSSERLLADLAQLYDRAGRASYRHINNDPGMAQAATYRIRFGSINRAYELAGIPKRRPDQLLLNELLRLYEREGKVTWKLINSERGMSAVRTYVKRFGSLPNAYKLAGLDMSLKNEATMIDDLVSLHRRTGKLTDKLINSQPGMFTAQTYRARFGSMKSAYERAGIEWPRKSATANRSRN